MMIDRILLAPYYYSLKLRHFLYDRGIFKSTSSEVPTICVGNVTVGGTGKTPHTEMLLRLLTARGHRGIAVLSRGYRRKSKGFRIVTADGTAAMFGDEPLQMKRKFPDITFAVDRSRVEGCRILAKGTEGAEPASLILLDDAFQHRALKPTVSIVLTDWSRPVPDDHLIPFGNLRDLPERTEAADIIIVTKCPGHIDGLTRYRWAEALGIRKYDATSCQGISGRGKVQYLFFTTIGYDAPRPVWDGGDSRYIHSKRLILFSGIANDTPLRKYLSDSYSIVRHMRFGDHHNFSSHDVRKIEKAAREFPTAVAMTTEKDANRLGTDPSLRISGELRSRMFFTPIMAQFLSEGEEGIFVSTLENFLK